MILVVKPAKQANALTNVDLSISNGMEIQFQKIPENIQSIKNY
ncbi:MAG: hypothetical protein AB8U26_03260 [Rickettsiales endosymbiont of Dermacentor nuttalli]